MNREELQVLDKNPGGQWIALNRGKLSFAVSMGIVLLLDRLQCVTFDSVMPYLAGIALWAVLWNKKGFFAKKWLFPAALFSIVICVDLCVEGFLALPVSPAAIVRFLVMYGIVFLLVGGFGFQLPSEKSAKIIHIIGGILFGLFSSAGNYIAFERIAMPERPFVFFLLFLLSFLSWSMLFGGALNAFHFVAGHMNCQRTEQVRFRSVFVFVGGGYSA